MPLPRAFGLVLLIVVAVAAHRASAQPAGPPTISVTGDNTKISSSCVLRFKPGAAIPDADGNGVLHIEADGITVEFEEGSVLNGANGGTSTDEFAGSGVRIVGRMGVTVRNARIRGFKSAIHATRCNGLAVTDVDLSDNFRQRLKSSPEAEDASDWLWPHENDGNEWLNNYGAALYIEDSSNTTVHDVIVRRGQNGIVLDRVNNSRIYDNDCSFLSGWGLAMWRSSGNLVSRNAFDFCVRGHSEGIYNRGQDSAGVLAFEQCNRNVFAENSVTHGGDGFFAFAGKESIGEEPAGGSVVDYADSGCNDNILVGNDFSDAPAHGVEITFSKRSRVIRNRIVGNGICGIWGGYSRDSRIVENIFDGNGALAYGLERGAINIEHGSGNLIVRNVLVNNRCGVHLWWDDDAKLLELPGVKAGYAGVSGNVIAANSFEINRFHPFTGAGEPGSKLPVLQLRDAGVGNVRDNLYTGNRVTLSDPRAQELDIAPGCEPKLEGDVPEVDVIEYPAVGLTEPFGAREELRGRHNIIMDEWGPWDHRSVMVRRGVGTAGRHAYEVFGVDGDLEVSVEAGDVQTRLDAGPLVRSYRVWVECDQGVRPYTLRLHGPGLDRRVSGTLINAAWTVMAFPWTIDPREDLDGWRAHAASDAAVAFQADGLNFAFGSRGPKQQRIREAGGKEVAGELPGPDRFGLIATTRLRLPAGRWRFSTLSDDGVRVRIGGTPVIDNWTWHGPTRDEGVFEQAQDGEIEIVVEYFEIDGFAVLKLVIEPA